MSSYTLQTNNYSLYEFNDAASHNTAKRVDCVCTFSAVDDAIVTANSLQAIAPEMTFMVLDRYGRQRYATKNYNNDNYVSA